MPRITAESENANKHYVNQYSDFSGDLTEEHLNILGTTTQICAMAQLGSDYYSMRDDDHSYLNGSVAAARQFCVDMGQGKYRSCISTLVSRANGMVDDGPASHSSLAQLAAGVRLGLLGYRNRVVSSKYIVPQSVRLAFMFAEDPSLIKDKTVRSTTQELAEFYANQFVMVNEDYIAMNGLLDNEYELVCLRTIQNNANFFAGLYLR